jgi:mRNA turnover protein 4
VHLLCYNIAHGIARLTRCRIFFGKTKLLAKALGTDVVTEHLPGLSQLAPHLYGPIGLLLSPRSPSEILPFLSSFVQKDFARAGVTATRNFTIPAGTVHSRGGEIAAEEDVPVAHSVEVTLRKWGMPTRLDKGRVMLDGDYDVCKAGQVLDSRQTALLKMFGVDMAEFRVNVIAYWEAAVGKVVVVKRNNGVMEQ